MTALEGVVLYEEFGRSLAPSPHFVELDPLRRGAGPGRQRRAEAGVAATASSPARPSSPRPGSSPRTASAPAGVQVRAVPDGDGFTITGTKRHVAFASAATRLVVLARTGDGPGDVDLFLVDPAAAGRDPDPADDHRLGRPVPGGPRPACGSTAADRIGGRRHRLVDLGHGHARRDHPGRGPGRRRGPVRHGHHRAVRQGPPPVRQAARAPSRPWPTTWPTGPPPWTAAEVLVHEAAWARSEGRDVAKLAPMAKLFACQTFRDVTATAQQIFGGIGFTVEFDIQLYFRRAKQLQISWWDTRYLEELVAAAVLDA